ncbi:MULTISPECIES: NAD(P)-dependent oxidoreductase [Paenibacillus]|jgi:uronate dehydrogenase|uniref:NAD-dependent epimerase/dehydratase family protein n=1 Tax=Paenibacillus TaxID=44249 RepID=UPI0006A6C564|nr:MULTISPECIES: NAD(P)-dependent oxidoreductase [Paenibacillus]ALA43176.1 NAD-dependent epimerase [Paenibacillus peoriae]MCP3743706.1 NAD(P)-dependent oxidoreductase [Paenibacillus sp. A3M_27_13]MXO79332.1 NAD-dependent epimerase/dehydratase family protein [Paenibacillus sp. OT2-17]OMF72696.1 NAD-dependent epimerase [Paenibacillus peoriae]
MARKLLITGAAGTIGKVLYEGLKAEGKYEIIAADVKRDEEAGIVEMDIHDAARLAELTRGVDTVLHFAWIKDEGDFLGKVLSGNVSGAYKLYEAAVKNGVKRIVFASSNHATGFYKVGESIDVEDPYRPDSFYGLSKCYIELLGRLYADQGKISSMNIRIGNFPGDDRPHSERAAHIWISERDMIRLTVCCIEARPEMSYLNLYGTSANTDNYYDIGYLEELIGYKPQDNAAELLEQAKKIGFWVKQDETTFQGGQKE